MPYRNLPNELLIQIVNSVELARDFVALLHTSRLLASIAAPILLARSLDPESPPLDSPPRRYWLQRTPMHWAAAHGNLPMIRWLIRCGYQAQVNKPGEFTSWPLLSAAIQNHVDVLECLLANGADPNGADPNVVLLGFWGTMWTPLHCAIANGNLRAVSLLIAHGADLTRVTQPGEHTPLFHAVIYSRVEIVHALLDAGVDVHTRSPMGVSALEYAVAAQAVLEPGHESADLVALLYNYGARLPEKVKAPVPYVHMLERRQRESKELTAVLDREGKRWEFETLQNLDTDRCTVCRRRGLVGEKGLQAYERAVPQHHSRYGVYWHELSGATMSPGDGFHRIRNM